VEHLPGDPHLPGRPYRATRARRGRSSLSFRLVMTVGLTAALAGTGIAVASGMVQTPLSDNAKSPEAATLGPRLDMAEPTANAASYALATLPASMLPHATPTKSKSVKPTTHPSATPSAAKSSSAASGLLTPQPTAQNETPTGQNQKAWSEAILTALGAPLTSANIISIGYWMQNEAGSPPSGIVGANNPINVSEPCCGGVPIQDDGDGVTFLQSYPSVSQGVQAIATYLERGNYVDIVAALRAGAGLSGSNLAPEIALYSGNGYTTIPNSWGASQGQPLG
jgi:hypothetical protein